MKEEIRFDEEITELWWHLWGVSIGEGFFFGEYQGIGSPRGEKKHTHTKRPTGELYGITDSLESRPIRETDDQTCDQRSKQTSSEMLKCSPLCNIMNGYGKKKKKKKCIEHSSLSN